MSSPSRTPILRSGRRDASSRGTHIGLAVVGRLSALRGVRPATRRVPVDLVAAPQARANLDRIAEEHPELLGASGSANVAGWTSALGELMSERNALTSARLDEIERRCNAATHGPWRSYVEGRDHSSGSTFIMTGAADALRRGRGRAIGPRLSPVRQPPHDDPVRYRNALLDDRPVEQAAPPPLRMRPDPHVRVPGRTA
jgi:hypothetical protein